jgi:hypothetical protein
MIDFVIGSTGTIQASQLLQTSIGYELESGPKNWGLGGNHQGIKGSPCHSELLNYQR